MQKKRKEKEEIIRNSIDCIDCIHNNNCKYKYTISVFEKNYNVEIDCWLKKVNKFIFLTGLHKQVYIPLENNNFIGKWVHAVGEKFDILWDNFPNN